MLWVLFITIVICSDLIYNSYNVLQVTESNLATIKARHSDFYMLMHMPSCNHSE
jgi:hypothetical protein